MNGLSSSTRSCSSISGVWWLSNSLKKGGNDGYHPATTHNVDTLPLHSNAQEPKEQGEEDVSPIGVQPSSSDGSNDALKSNPFVGDPLYNIVLL